MSPACKNYLWGGRRLIEDYGIDYYGDILAEAWMLSAHKDGASTILNGTYAGKTFRQYIDAEGVKVFGENCRIDEFPVLIKLIDAQDNLSVQVHPSDKYAQKFENQLGKHEMWYIIDAAPDSFIYLGLNHTVSKEEFAERIKNETLTEILQKIYVKSGDSFFIPAGTIHSIGKGILLAEVQQSSNVSYRIYDYGRVDSYGNKRDLHIDKALDVADLSAADLNEKKYPHLAACDYFTVDKINLDGKITSSLEGTVTEKSFLSVLILDGRGIISVGIETLNFKKGDSFFLPAYSGNWQIKGVADILLTYI